MERFTRILFAPALLAAALSVAAANRASGQEGARTCLDDWGVCDKNCKNKSGSFEQNMCSVSCQGPVIGCMQTALRNAEDRLRDLKAKVAEERKKITCEGAQGNVQHCVQHGTDLK